MRILLTLVFALVSTATYIGLVFIGFSLVNNHTFEGSLGGIALILAGYLQGLLLPPTRLFRTTAKAAARGGEDGRNG